jgi:hypothetical protein
MKHGIAGWFPVIALSVTIVFPIRSLAQRSSYSSTTTTTMLASSSTSASAQPEMTNTATTPTGDNRSSWKQSASDTAYNAEIATERAYNHTARGVKDISLEGRILAVLHENKFTRDSVHVTADNGIITLTGKVQSEQNAQRVQEVVASVYGVKAVKNDLNYPTGAVTPRDADLTGIAHPAYSDTAPAENAPAD